MNAIDGKTRICGLIGNPVEHTKSPVIHNTLAKLTGENLAYGAFHVEKDRLEEAVRGAYGLNMLGMNVTVPYKEAVIPYLKELDPLAEKIGAVNTLVRVEGGFKGYNTDMPGLYRAMEGVGVSVRGEHVVILGAGGVARAVAILLAEKGAASITLLNRSVDRAEDLADEVNRLFGSGLARALPLAEYEELSDSVKYLGIQATSVGMSPNVEDVVLDAAVFYRKLHTGYDLIFNPAETRFMKLASAAGARTYNGADMLLYQGILAFEYWTGRQITEEMAEVVRREMACT